MKCFAVFTVVGACSVHAAQTVLQAEPANPASAYDGAKRVLTPALKDFVQDIVDQYPIPGLTLGIVRRNEVEFGTWGRKSEDDDPITVDTLMYLASCSKAFLSSAVGILMDDFAHGRNNTPLPAGVPQFDWYTPVKDILPDEWELMDEWATQRATIRDVLSHQSGVPRHDLSYSDNDTPLDVILRMKYLRPAFELRQRYHYNNQMFMLGSYIVSKYAGVTYMEYLKERVWKPLNMSSTTFYASEAAVDDKLSQFWTGNNGRRIPPWFPDEHVPLNAGAGGVISSAADMVQWVKMLLKSGRHPTSNETVVPQSAFDMITSAQIVVNKRASYPDFSISGYGMGWSRHSYLGHEIISHGGAIPGISTNVFILPGDDLGLVILANADDKHLQEHIISYRLIEDYLGLQRIHSTRMRKLLDDKASEVSVAGDNSVAATKLPSTGPPLPLEAYAGTYVDPGYPVITLCASTSTSPECQDTLKQFSHFENVTASDVLYASLPSVWISHARVQHVEGNTFYLSGTYLFPNGYGKDTSPFETREEGSEEALLEFVVDESDSGGPRVVGAGARGMVGETTNRQRIGGSVEDVAEVYFRKIR